MYVLSTEPAASAAQLKAMLHRASVHDDLSVAKWLRQQGAPWPAVLIFGGAPWKATALQWARDEGCISPTTRWPSY
jgi:hypothetical protein